MFIGIRKDKLKFRITKTYCRLRSTFESSGEGGRVSIPPSSLSKVKWAVCIYTIAISITT